MAKVAPPLAQFNGGEYSPLFAGRTDHARYYTGCTAVLNFIPTVLGPVRRRTGTRFVQAVKDSSDRTWLVPFQFNVEQAYQLEFGDLYIRFYLDHGPLLLSALTITGITAANPAVVSSTAHGLSNGDRVIITGVLGMVELNNREFTVAGVTANTFQLSGVNSSAYTAYASGGTASEIYEIVSPYAVADLTDSLGNFRLSVVQSGDVLFIAHPDYPLQKLSRLAATSWTIADATLEGGPWLDENADETHTITASGTTGSVTLTASSALFASTDIGRLVYLQQKGIPGDVWESGQVYADNDIVRWQGNYYQADGAETAESVPPTHLEGTANDGTGGVNWEYLHSGYGWAVITGFTNSTTVTATVQSRLPSTTATYRWRLGIYSDTTGYPEVVSFFRERLVLAKGQRLSFSTTGDFENYEIKEGDQVVADNGFTIEVSSDQANIIRWLVPTNVLLIGTAGGEYVCSEISSGEVFSPTNATIKEQSRYGSSAVRAIKAGDSTLYVQRAGRKVREIAYNFDTDRFVSPDRTLLAEHITTGGLVGGMAWQNEPDATVWAPRADGVLLAMTFNLEDAASVYGWYRNAIGGYSDADQEAGAVVECVSVIPTPDGDADELWAIVRRHIDGATVRYVEYLTQPLAMPERMAGESDVDFAARNLAAQKDAYFVDGGLIYDGAAADELSGFWHLRGETVQALVDGAAHADVTIGATGKLTLSREGEKVAIGYGYTSEIETMRIEAGSRNGTAQGKTKRVIDYVLRLHESLGGEHGTMRDAMDPILYRTVDHAMDQPVPLFSGDTDPQQPPSGHELAGRVVIRQTQPLPFTLVAIYPQVQVSDER